MPKLKESDQQKQDNLFRAVVAKYMTMRGIKTKKELAVRIGLCETTFLYKLKSPDKFTRGELRRLFRALSIPAEESRDIAVG